MHEDGPASAYNRHNVYPPGMVSLSLIKYDPSFPASNSSSSALGLPMPRCKQLVILEGACSGGAHYVCQTSEPFQPRLDVPVDGCQPAVDLQTFLHAGAKLLQFTHTQHDSSWGKDQSRRNRLSGGSRCVPVERNEETPQGVVKVRRTIPYV